MDSGKGKSSLGARLGWALGRAVGTTLRSLREPKGDAPAGHGEGVREVAEVGRETREAETRDDEGRKVVLRRTTIDEVEIER